MNAQTKAMRTRLATFGTDARGVAATEFAFIVPLMLVIFFGTVEVSNGVAVNRKVTLMARTLSDLVSQATTVGDSDITNSFNASAAIMTPYTSSLVQAKVSEVKIDGSGNATVAWSKASNATARSVGSTVTLPSALAIPNSYLIWSEISYVYTPAVGYVMKTAVTLTDQTYTRPRQANCVLYSPQTVCP